nr:putative ribonuclease H-like domain-containing protein [Tanacetum cinerariifolium]
MCDRKNNVIFTDSECLVLSPNFKLPDASQILLRVPRKNNMYNVDMKNIVPNESMLWHRRLRRINFKIINKLVKENLVRGLNIKHFENDQTCVACLKGKQHKASSTKDETTCILKMFITKIENLVDKKVKIIRCDNRTEFKNSVVDEFCAMKGIIREFSVARTLQQNGVADRRNRTLIGAARTMVLVVKPHNKAPYELFRVRLLVYNIRTGKVKEKLHVRFLEDKPIIEEKPENNTHDVNTDGPSTNTHSTNFNTGSLNISTVSPPVTNATPEATYADFFGDEREMDISNITTTYQVPFTLNTRIHKDHSLDHVIGDVQSGVQTKRMKKTTNEQGFISAIYEGKTHEDLNTCLFTCFFSQIEPTRVAKALTDLVFRNKKDERYIVIKNKVRLVAQGYTQEEGIDYDEVFAPVARIKAIRLFLAYASFMGFIVYQMDVKSAFLYGRIEEEVYVCQPLGFEDPDHRDKVYKVVKALYGLHQAPRAWYETLANYLLGNRDSPFELVAYTDSDYASASLDMKSTRGCQFLGSKLISWQCKKQIMVATSIIEVEYVAAASCCGQTATVRAVDNGEQEITATVDGKAFNTTEASVSTQGEVHSQEDQPQNQLGVFNATKILTDAARKTYTRRRRAVSTGSGGTSKASRLLVLLKNQLVLLVHQCQLVPLVWFKKLVFLHQLHSKIKRVSTFVPIESEEDKTVPKLAEAGSSKRDAGEELDQGKSKKQKINTRKYWKIIIVGNHTQVYHFFDDILKAFDMDDLVMLWSLVKERSSLTEPTDDKEIALWVELKRLFEPDTDDELWKL